MSDLLNLVNYLRFYYTATDSLKDKDILKNRYFYDYQTRVITLFTVPAAVQLWQISLINVHEKAALYRKVRVFKSLTLAASIYLAVEQKASLEKKWTYLNRLYPEPTELQKTLFTEA